MALTLTVDDGGETGRQRIDHGYTHAVQTTGDLVPAPLAELAPGIQFGQHDLGCRTPVEALVLMSHGGGGNTATVVFHPTAAVSEQRDGDGGGKSSHCLVDRIIHHLPHAVVQPGDTG